MHLLAQKLYLIPILTAAALLGPGGATAITAAVSVLYLGHVLLDWRGQTMLQAEQVTELVTFWVVGATAALLFGRVKRTLEQLHRAHEDALAVLVGSLELREKQTAGHSERVRDYSLLIASQMGVRDPVVLGNIGAGALFHDIGKIGVPDAILQKDGALEAWEQLEMRKHPQLGATLIGRVRFLTGVSELVLSHHERFDGTGYPRGLQGSAIPLGARIFAVADAFDAMTTDRPYRRATSLQDARQALRNECGAQFDPDVVNAFLETPMNAVGEVALRHGVVLKVEGT